MGRRKHRRAHGEPLAAAPPPPSSGPPAPATPAPAARVPTERLDAVLGLLAAPDSGAASRDGSSTRTGARARPATDPGADWPPELRARYRPLEELGRGGSGVVVRVRDLQMGRDAALKLLQVSAFTDPDHLVRFRREVLATAGLRHPHVVTIYDVGEAGGRPYYTMEWIEGASLAELARRRSLAPREAVEIARQIAEALAAGHAAGIIHRDVKPHNILVREAPASSGAATWHAYVADFGLAKFVLRDAADAATLHRSVMSLTRENQVLGTPWYMSPEQVKGDPLDPRTDVYSLGATLYELLVGAPPLEAPTLAEQFRRIVHDDPVPPRRRNAEVDADLETIVLVCLQKNPAQRYPTAGALAEDCRRWLAGETPAARAVGPVRRLWRRARRNPSVAIPTALLAILLLGAPVVLGGSALLDAARTRRALVAGEAALAAGDWREAGRQAEAADGWAPGDAAAAALMALARADEQAEQGDGGFSRYRATAQRVDALIEERTRLAARLRQARTQAEMRPLWEIAGRIHEAEHECEIAFETAAARYSAALGFHPTHARANERLGDLYWACWVDARESGNVGERRAYEALILRHAPTKYGAALHATGGLEIDLLPGTAPRAVPLRAYLYRFEDAVVPPVSAPHPVVPATGAPAGELALGPSEPRAGPEDGGRRPGACRLADPPAAAVPFAEVREAGGGGAALRFATSLPEGTYLLHIPPGQGVWPVRIPIGVTPGESRRIACRLVGEGEGPPFSVAGPPSEEAEPEWVLIPDVDRGDAAFVSRFEVTREGYLAYLNDRGWQSAERARTRLPAGVEGGIEEGGDGVFRLIAGARADVPVCGVSAEAASDFARRATARAGGEWEIRLPKSEEWQRAFQGDDERRYPWGNEFHRTFCRALGSRPDDPPPEGPEPVGLFPLDEGPHGVRDLAGGVREWTSSRPAGGAALRIVRGGAWSLPASLCAVEAVDVRAPGVRDASIGFRLAAQRSR